MTYDDWRLAHPSEYDEGTDDDDEPEPDDDTPECNCGTCIAPDYTCIRND
jgi:hypothetical protein